MPGKTRLIEGVRSLLENWRERALHYKQKSLDGLITGYDAEIILDNHLIPLRAQLDKAAGITNIADQATEEWNYPANEISADFNAIRTSIQATGDWIVARDTNLWQGYDRADTTWARSLTPFTSADTAGLRTELDADVAAIDTFIGKIAADL